MFDAKRMNLYHTLLFFGVPGVLMMVGTYWLVPLLSRNQVPLILSWTITVWGPVVLLALGVLWSFYRKPDRISFSKRFRFRKLSRKELLWTLAAFIVVQGCELFLHNTGTSLAQLNIFAPPVVIPDLFSPNFNLGEGLSSLCGVPLKGNWWLVGFWLFWLVLNIGGEEFLWRGYALPLQEKVFGKWAWLINGLCWNILVHMFFRWNYVTLLPISLIAPYLVQKFQNTWISVIIHGTGNALMLVMIIPGII